MDNNLLEKYLNEACKNLEIKDTIHAREDIKGIIFDELEKGKSLEEVLNELGDPVHLGAKYYNYGNLLISGNLYSHYENSLKVGFGAILVSISAYLIYTSIFESNIYLRNVGIIENIVEGLLIIFSFITVSFFIVERAQDKKRFQETDKTWDVSMLKNVQLNNTKSKTNLIMIGVYIVIYLSAIIYAKELMIYDPILGERIKLIFQFILALSIFKTVFKFKSNYKSPSSKNVLKITNILIIICSFLFLSLGFKDIYLLLVYGIFAFISSSFELFKLVKTP